VQEAATPGSEAEDCQLFLMNAAPEQSSSQRAGTSAQVWHPPEGQWIPEGEWQARESL